MKSISYTLKILDARIKKIIWVLGLHAFSLILLFVFIDFIVGGFVFYKYIFLAGREEFILTENIIRFDEATYKKVLGELQAREQESKELSATPQPSPPAQPQNTPKN